MKPKTKTAVIIAIEGLNAAGKSFLSQRLKQQLILMKHQVLYIKAPIYEIQDDQIDHFGPLIYSYLNQKDIQSQYTNEQIDEMFKINRQYIQNHIIAKQLNNYDFIIIDRWIMSGAVYSCYRSQIPRIRSNSNEVSIDITQSSCQYQRCNQEMQIMSAGIKQNSTSLSFKEQSVVNNDKNQQCPLSLSQFHTSCAFHPHNDQGSYNITDQSHNALSDQQITDNTSQTAVVTKQLPLFNNNLMFQDIINPFYHITELIPDYTLFLDTNINDILYRIQSRQQFNTDPQQMISTQRQIYSNLNCLEHVRILFRHYINQHVHNQKISILDNNHNLVPIFELLFQNNYSPEYQAWLETYNQDQQTYYTCNSRAK